MVQQFSLYKSFLNFRKMQVKLLSENENMYKLYLEMKSGTRCSNYKTEQQKFLNNVSQKHNIGKSFEKSKTTLISNPDY